MSGSFNRRSEISDQRSEIRDRKPARQKNPHPEVQKGYSLLLKLSALSVAQLSRRLYHRTQIRID